MMMAGRGGVMSEHRPGSIEWYREKFPRSELEHKPASMRKGSDKAPLFWIGYFVLFAALALYFGSKAG
jgi:hypothetical protein